MGHTILLVDDDVELCEFISNTLENDMYTVVVSNRGANVTSLLDKYPVDLLILDLALPDVDGMAICKLVSESYPTLRIIILSASVDITDKLNAFGFGSDDYITKPFNIDELKVRIKARLKNRDLNQKLQLADLVLDPVAIKVKRGDKDIHLTAQEFKLLETLMANSGKVLSREQLLSKLWANSFEIETRVVDVYISYLRKKIDKGYTKKLIHSRRGFGYSIQED